MIDTSTTQRQKRYFPTFLSPAVMIIYFTSIRPLVPVHRNIPASASTTEFCSRKHAINQPLCRRQALGLCNYSGNKHIS